MKTGLYAKEEDEEDEEDELPEGLPYADSVIDYLTEVERHKSHPEESEPEYKAPDGPQYYHEQTDETDEITDRPKEPEQEPVEEPEQDDNKVVYC